MDLHHRLSQDQASLEHPDGYQHEYTQQIEHTNQSQYRTPVGMRREEFRAMGTTVSLLLPEKQIEPGMKIVQALFTEWEEALSRFLPTSELSHLNQHPGVTMAVSDLVYRVLTTAIAAAQATEGVYDPTLLDQLEQLGYDRTFEALPPVRHDLIVHSKPGGGWRGIQVDTRQRHVTIPTGTRLDFGGIAKGMAVDAALERLGQSGVSSALVNAGGDLAVRGQPIASTEQSWSVAVPGRERSWTIPLRHGAVATSGIARRHWWQGQVLQHHLLDPRTGQPVRNDLWSVTVVADQCMQAEIAAKVAFILGPRQGAEFLRRQQIAGLFVRQDGSWETVEPWPRELMEEQQ
jgi:thiamine biosynthesis lipoprotein